MKDLEHKRTGVLVRHLVCLYHKVLGIEDPSLTEEDWQTVKVGPELEPLIS